ncbi:MAG: polysaccharide biosynthesis protein [Firmicutes bacterium]|nr:polysaccharide biosynthesis protein [Bacillota bacterium]
MIKKAFGKVKKQGFVTGALTLAAAGILCRIIGIGFRIPFANIVGNYGMGLYQMVFPLYALLLILSSAGIPIAISKMVARTNTDTEDKGKAYEPKKILLNAIILLGFIGFIISTAFLIFARQIASLQGNPDVGKIYLVIAPAVFLVCLISAFRGYFQGLGNMIPTAVSQIVEQTVKVGIAITLAILLYPRGVEWAVFGAIAAITLSEIVGLLTLITIFIFHKRKQNKPEKTKTNKLKNGISFPLMWEILKKSLPITAMASIFPLILVFDSMVVIKMLEYGGASKHVATQLYGISSGTVHTLINMPAILGIAIGTAVVPMTARLLKQNKTDEVREKFALAVKMIYVIAIFFALFYIVFGREIITLLYERAFKDNPDQLQIATRLLKIESVMILLMGMSQVFTSMLQGAGRAKFPLISLAIGGAVKVAFSLIFIRTGLGIYAVSIGNVLCFAIAFTLNAIFAIKFLKIKISLRWRTLKLFALLVLHVGILIVLVYLLPSGKFWIVIGGIIGFIAYATFVFCLRIFQKGKNLIKVEKEST